MFFTITSILPFAVPVMSSRSCRGHIKADFKKKKDRVPTNGYLVAKQQRLPVVDLRDGVMRNQALAHNVIPPLPARRGITSDMVYNYPPLTAHCAPCRTYDDRRFSGITRAGSGTKSGQIRGPFPYYRANSIRPRFATPFASGSTSLAPEMLDFEMPDIRCRISKGRDFHD